MAADIRDCLLSESEPLDTIAFSPKREGPLEMLFQLLFCCFAVAFMPISLLSTESEQTPFVLQGRLDTLRARAIYSPLPNAEFQIRDHNILYAWGIDYVCGNGIIEKDQNRIPTDEEIDRAIKLFAAKALPFIWWTSAKVLETKGFQFGATLTGVILDISENLPIKPTALSDLTIEIVQTEPNVKIFTELAASTFKTFTMSSTATEQWFALNTSLMNSGEQVHFLARFEGIPVGTATLSVSPLSTGIWNVTTLPEYRNRGIGGALVHAALVEAKKRKYSQVMALLIREGMAWGLFMKLGFKEVCDFPFYVYSKEK